MSVDMSFITIPESSSNHWIVAPSGTDATDSDNIQYALTHAAADRVTKVIPADVELKAGVFHCRKPMYVADFQGVFRGAGKGTNGTQVIVGTQIGGPMDLFLAPQAALLSPSGLPMAFTFYGLAGGDGSNVECYGIYFKTVPSTDSTPSCIYFNAPWANSNIMGFLNVRGKVGQSRTGVLSAITGTAPTMGATSIAGLFTLADVGSKITIDQDPTSGNNGLFTVVSFIDANHITYTNGSGVANGSANCAWAIKPDVMPMGRRDCNVHDCKFEGDLGNPVSDYLGTAVSTVDYAIWVDDDFSATVQGTSTKPGLPSHYFKNVTTNGTFWFPGGRFPANGIVEIADCDFIKCGASLDVSANMDFVAPNVNWSLPVNAVPASIKVLRCTHLNCGFEPAGGTGGVLGLFGNLGYVEAANNVVSWTIPTNDPDNGLCFLQDFGPPTVAWPRTGKLEFSPWKISGQIQLSTTVSNHNTFYYHDNQVTLPGPGSGGVQAFCSIQIEYSGNAATNQPAQTNRDLRIARNLLIGDTINSGISLEPGGMDGGLIDENVFQGSGTTPDIIIDKCQNITCKNNTYRPDKTKVRGYITATSTNCQFIDETNSRPTANAAQPDVLNLGGPTNNVIGLGATIDPTFTP